MKAEIFWALSVAGALALACALQAVEPMEVQAAEGVASAGPSCDNTAWRFLAKLPARLDPILGNPMRLAIRGAHGRIEAKERLVELTAIRSAMAKSALKDLARRSDAR